LTIKKPLRLKGKMKKYNGGNLRVVDNDITKGLSRIDVLKKIKIKNQNNVE